jgi:hypothetical protein
MKNRKYRIKDLRNSTETKADYVTNSAGHKLYTNPGLVANKLKDLTRNGSSYG